MNSLANWSNRSEIEFLRETDQDLVKFLKSEKGLTRLSLAIFVE